MWFTLCVVRNSDSNDYLNLLLWHLGRIDLVMILVELFQSLIFTSAFVRVGAQLGRCRDRYPDCQLFALSRFLVCMVR